MYYRALISATSKREALKILDALTKNRLVAGGLVTQGESQYWWKEKRVKKTYANLSVFTVARHKKAIIALVRKIHKDEVPIVAFFKIDDGNDDFLGWVLKQTNPV